MVVVGGKGGAGNEEGGRPYILPTAAISHASQLVDVATCSSKE